MSNNAIDICAWNTGGWHGPNQPSREAILYRLDAGIVFLCETKTSANDCVTLNGYHTIYNNRSNIHIKATHGSVTAHF